MNKAFRNRRGSANERPLSTIQLLPADLEDDLEPIFHMLKRKYSLDYDGYEATSEPVRTVEIADERVVGREQAEEEQEEEEIIDAGDEWKRIGELFTTTFGDVVADNGETRDGGQRRMTKQEKDECLRNKEHGEANLKPGNDSNESLCARASSLGRVEEEIKEEAETGQEKAEITDMSEQDKTNVSSEKARTETDDTNGVRSRLSDGNANANSAVPELTPKKQNSVRPKSWQMCIRDSSIS